MFSGEWANIGYSAQLLTVKYWQLYEDGGCEIAIDCRNLFGFFGLTETSLYQGVDGTLEKQWLLEVRRRFTLISERKSLVSKPIRSVTPYVVIAQGYCTLHMPPRKRTLCSPG